MPTAWFYVHSLGGTEMFLGLVVSVYSIAALLLSPVFGALYDKFRRLKVVLTILHLARLSGNVMYTIPISKYFPLSGRILCGVSSAGDAVLLGELARITNRGAERAKAFLLLEGLYTLGASFGPLLASIITFNIDMFGWKINEGNSPGFVMIIIWSVIVIWTFFLPKSFKKEDEHDTLTFQSDDDNDDISEKKTSAKYSSCDYYCKITCIFYLMFLACFLCSVVIFYTPLLAMEHFHLEHHHIKILFLNGTLSLLTVYLILYILAEYFKERTLVLIVVSLQIIPIIVLLVLALFWNSGLQELSYLLIIYICFGMSYCLSALGCSLLSKITNPDQSSFYQGISLAIIHGGIITGRIIPSLFFTKMIMIYFSLGVVFLWAFGFGWLCFVYESLENY